MPLEAPQSCYCAAVRAPCGWCSDPERTEEEFQVGRTIHVDPPEEEGDTQADYENDPGYADDRGYRGFTHDLSQDG